MVVDDLEKMIKEDVLSLDIADMYLKIYVADIDWKPHISQLWSNAVNKSRDQNDAKNHVKKAIACTTLAPFYDKTIIPDPPENLLFWLPTWRQFSEKDWLSLYKKVISEDIEIRKNRKKLLSLGIIDPIDYVPMTRQAFNWIYSKAEDANCITNDNKEDLIKKFQNLIRIYGGATICNLFMKHEASVNKIVNWRSGYFFEKEIYKVYSLDQIVKIKNLEISKIDSKYVKKIKTNNKEK